MARFHFVEDYERYVADLTERHPIDEAMALAVGGSFKEVGAIESDVMTYAGLKSGMSLLDLGCGSGRLAVALSGILDINFLGIDVVQQLLDYAASKSPKHYRYKLNQTLTLPAEDESFDFFSAFSVFTHLLHSESYLYLEDAWRALRPGGTVVFSFLEFANPEHWQSFETEVSGRRSGVAPHLNTMIERNAIQRWAKELGYVDVQFVDGREAPWQGQPMWQAVAIMKRP
jgi:ubiquinone/menaquinone biosynthesis C-methylase UbiE